jgi:peptide-methionine (S)-S-oxide reductase
MKQYLISLAGAIILMSCANPEKGTQKKSEDLNNNQKSKVMETKNLDTATFGGGCFWCVEAVYQQLNGVVSVASGYSGGPRANPSYEQVCSGATGHAEVIQIVYDATKISFDELLQVFWTVHDPTTLNRQGADVGTQYRSVVFYHNDNQKELTESYIEKLNAEHAFNNPVVTEVSPFTVFYKAEDYHQNYYNDNQNQPYCSFVIQPKVEKFKKVFGDKLKK